MKSLVVLSVFLLGGAVVVKAEEPVIDPEAMLQKLKTENVELEKEIKVLRDKLDVLEQRILNNKNSQLGYEVKYEWNKNVRKHYLQDLKKANEGLEKNQSAKFRTLPYSSSD
ncbi:hypothetical protein [Singulisphaera acidiphila]|uniref:Uncharacterized protein n=1 Tax=Singulisphaera acidiphila (strain ATCC BAA-1392 / DSM 18658 / VKM B-2454 / MOB10) TaxID=886293 RepID=L0DJN9_SINAD|nr:hypothetical protein [Singulisphaera acidiphila]AGA29048.1 hypothetical protein Sinac_4891 [Singulisphaera acidiphila DSM 18658]